MTKLKDLIKENDLLLETLLNLVIAISDIANGESPDITETHKHFEKAVRVIDSRVNKDRTYN